MRTIVHGQPVLQLQHSPVRDIAHQLQRWILLQCDFPKVRGDNMPIHPSVQHSDQAMLGQKYDIDVPTRSAILELDGLEMPTLPCRVSPLQPTL